MAEWGPTLRPCWSAPARTRSRPLLAERLAALTRARIDAPALLHRALSEGPLPDDHNAAALWWRLAGHLSPAVAAQAGTEHHVTAPWTPQLAQLVGGERAEQLRASSWWPALVAVVDHAVSRGANPHDLLATIPDAGADLDACQALVWHISVQNDPPPALEDAPEPTDVGAPEDEPNPFWEETADHPGHAPTEDEWDALRPVDDRGSRPARTRRRRPPRRRRRPRRGRRRVRPRPRRAGPPPRRRSRPCRP